MNGSLAMRVRLLKWAPWLLAQAIWSLILAIVAVTALGLVTVWVGVPVVLVVSGWIRVAAEQRRRHVSRITGTELPSPYLKPVEGGALERLRGLAHDPAVRRDLVWAAVDGTAGLALSVVALVEAILDLVFWWLPLGIAARTRLRMDRALLAPSEKSQLAQRVEQLTESRAETVDTQAAELRRIERDLHDGAQARLVALGMSLAMAEQQLDRDPEAVRALLTEARTTSSDALAELRDLVRGIHPPVLADRGLVGAVQAVALAAPIPVTVQAEVGRLPAPIESAAYFAVAEALTNVIKHADAQHAEVRLAMRGDELAITVRDDGRGGADASRGTGLRGIERRLSAFDGTLRVESPSGGPTQLVMVLRVSTADIERAPDERRG
jgi:signal transduction histidine kinase